MMYVFDLSAQGNCTITPMNPTSFITRGGVLPVPYGMQNVMIQCNCSDVIGIALDPIRWFYSNGSIIDHQTDHGFPYFTRAPDDKNVVLVIPTFNDSYDGIYSCGFGKKFPPKEPNLDISLTFGESLFNFQYQKATAMNHL